MKERSSVGKKVCKSLWQDYKELMEFHLNKLFNYALRKPTSPQNFRSGNKFLTTLAIREFNAFKVDTHGFSISKVTMHCSVLKSIVSIYFITVSNGVLIFQKKFIVQRSEFNKILNYLLW